MNKQLQMTGEKTAVFFSPISVDNGYTNSHQGNFKSTFEYFGDGTGGQIEWIVEDEKGNDIFVEHIGIWIEDKKLMDYDGVFELPKQAILFLRKMGFTVPEDFEA